MQNSITGGAMNNKKYIRFGMDRGEVLKIIESDKEASIYLNNILEKYKGEFDNFLNKLVVLKINSRVLEVLSKENNPLQAMRNASIDIIIHRLRQINCFGNPTKEYVNNVFNMTLKEISFE